MTIIIKQKELCWHSVRTCRVGYEKKEVSDVGYEKKKVSQTTLQQYYFLNNKLCQVTSELRDLFVSVISWTVIAYCRYVWLQ